MSLVLKIAAGIIIAVVVLLVGCSVLVAVSGSDNGGSDPEQATPEATAPSTPQSCLTDAGLENVEQRDADLWRAAHDFPFFLVTVSKMPTETAAVVAVNDASDVWGAEAGTYAVFGPARDVRQGRIVNTVAACLIR